MSAEVVTVINSRHCLGANPSSLVGFPSWVNLVIGGSGVIPAAFMAIILNLFLPESKEDWEEGGSPRTDNLEKRHGNKEGHSFSGG